MKYEVLNHSCIRLEGSKTIYFDPYEIKNEPHDADFVFVTHNHTTHFSPEDIFRVSKPIKLTPDDGFAPDNTIIVTPESVVMLNAVQNIVLQPGDAVFAFGIEIEAPDEVLDALLDVEKRLPPELKCATIGGLACTHTAKCVRERLAGDCNSCEH